MCGLGLGLRSWPQITSSIAKTPFSRCNNYQLLLGMNPSSRQWNQLRRGQSGLASGANCTSCSITHGNSGWNRCIFGASHHRHASAANLTGPTRPHGCTIGAPFLYACFGPDGVPPVMQARRPLPLAEGLPKLPAALGGYKHMLLKLGPVQLTRKGVSLAAAAASCLSFSVLQSASLCALNNHHNSGATLRCYLIPLSLLA